MIIKKIVSEKVPLPIGPYSQAVKVDNLIFLSGQLPNVPGEKDLIKGDINKEAEQVLKNIKSILEDNESSLDNVVKTTIFLKDLNDFQKVNEVYKKFFNNGILPSRSCIEVNKLPMDARIEIESIAIVKDS